MMWRAPFCAKVVGYGAGAVPQFSAERVTVNRQEPSVRLGFIGLLARSRMIEV